MTKYSDLRRVVYVGGIGRSGSTLIERLIGQLPGVCPVGELVHLWERGIVEDERCGCGEPFRLCPFWQQVGTVAFGGWDEVEISRIAALRSRVDRNRFIPALAPAGCPPGIAPGADRVHLVLRPAVRRDHSGERLCARRGLEQARRRWLICLRWQADLDLRVLHLIRDSRAVAYSWSRRVKRPDAPGEPAI